MELVDKSCVKSVGAAPLGDHDRALPEEDSSHATMDLTDRQPVLEAVGRRGVRGVSCWVREGLEQKLALGGSVLPGMSVVLMVLS